MRLIDADVLKENMFFHEIDNVSYAEEKDIDNTPTVDAVEVVRCKDCVHWDKSNLLPPRCVVFDWFSKKNDYCSFAERRSE